MDTTGIVLAVLAAIAIVGQATMNIWGGWIRRRKARQAKEQLARLLEDAADRQIQQLYGQAGKLTDLKRVTPDADH